MYEVQTIAIQTQYLIVVNLDSFSYLPTTTIMYKYILYCILNVIILTIKLYYINDILLKVIELFTQIYYRPPIKQKKINNLDRFTNDMWHPETACS